jgi:hypothetical protein
MTLEIKEILSDDKGNECKLYKISKTRKYETYITTVRCPNSAQIGDTICFSSGVMYNVLK